MSLALEETTITAAFIAPRDVAVTPFTWWERGGIALDDMTDGVDVRNWFFECDPDTGIVSVGVPDVIAATAIYTIAPLPVEVTGSFDLDMHPVLAWRDVNGDAFLRVTDANTALPARTQFLKLALDDVRDEQLAEVTDLILAYTRDNVLYCRQLSEAFAVETELAVGFASLYQIGMNTDFRFQFQRTAAQLDEPAPDLNYLRTPNRVSKMAGFDANGDAVLLDVVTVGAVGETSPPIFSTKLMGHLFFLRANDGQWGADTTVSIRFYRDLSLRARLNLAYAVDVYGNITRTVVGTAGETAVRISETGAGTSSYSATVYLSETGQGVSFNLLAVSATPVTRVFTPLWNTAADFRTFVPDGDVRSTDYGAYVVLHANTSDATYTGRSSSTRLRWGSGSLPVALRPSAARTASCSVSRNGDTVAGLAMLNSDGSAEFWPFDATSTRLARGTFQTSTTVTRTKGLPVDWQLVYAKDIIVLNPFPNITSFDPAIAEAGGPTFTLTINGTGFMPTSVVTVDGNPVTITFISDTEIEIEIEDTLTAAPTILTIEITNAAPGGGSDSADFEVVANITSNVLLENGDDVLAESGDFIITE